MFSTNKKNYLEICCYTPQSVFNARRGGADRVELCTAMEEGGTTPSAGAMMMAKEVEGIELYVMIRPRGGDFCYSDAEFEEMRMDIEMAKTAGVHGVVFGILRPDGTVDKERTKELVDFAQPFDVTFHRAFDMTKDPAQALEDIIACGITRILSSGTYNTAPEGIEVLELLVKQAGNRLRFMAASGVNASNVDAFHKIGIHDFHSSAITYVPTEMQYQNPLIKMGKEGSQSEFERPVADTHKVAAMRSVIDQLKP